MAVAHTTTVGSSPATDVDYDASQMASTLLFGLGLGLPDDKIGEQLTGPSAYNGENDDTKFATLVFWYVLNFSKEYEARTKKGGVTTTPPTIAKFLSMDVEGQTTKIRKEIGLPKNPGESITAVHKTVLALIEFNEQCAQARFVYNYLLQNRPQWFRLIDGVSVIDTFVAVNGPRPAAAAAAAAAATPAPASAAAPELEPTQAPEPEVAEEMDSDDDDFVNDLALSLIHISEPTRPY